MVLSLQENYARKKPPGCKLMQRHIAVCWIRVFPPDPESLTQNTPDLNPEKRIHIQENTNQIRNSAGIK